MKPLSSEPTPLANPAAFQKAIIAWFSETGKDYPWRRTVDPYAILVSEMMLQQTQIGTVLGKRYFETWLEKFPTPAALAAAAEPEILRAWEGLGYYNRARNLQKASQVVTEQFNGEFPQTAAELLQLPGIGRYTAGAVATFAFDAPEPIIDANIARVLARLVNYRELIDAEPGQSLLWKWATELVPSSGARMYNSGLMELGQRICTPKSPQCQNCPVADYCAAKEHHPELLPHKKPKRSTEHVVEHVGWAIRDGHLLLHGESGNRRKGLWKLPERDETYFSENLAPLLHASVYTITHHRVRLQIYEAPNMSPQKGEHWHPVSALELLPMPSPYRKVLKFILKDK